MDTFNKNKRSWIMAQVKSSGNRSTENSLIEVFREHKIRGWRRKYPLYGKPDFVFPQKHLAVFVDGCFWHGHPGKCRLPQTNSAYWERKIAGNVARDKKVNRILKEKGWMVIRIWEDRIKETTTLTKLRKALA